MIKQTYMNANYCTINFSIIIFFNEESLLKKQNKEKIGHYNMYY